MISPLGRNTWESYVTIRLKINATDQDRSIHADRSGRILLTLNQLHGILGHGQRPGRVARAVCGRDVMFPFYMMFRWCSDVLVIFLWDFSEIIRLSWWVWDRNDSTGSRYIKLIHVCFYFANWGLKEDTVKTLPPLRQGAWSTARQRNPPDEHNGSFHRWNHGTVDYKPLKCLKCVWFLKHSLQHYTKEHTLWNILRTHMIANFLWYWEYVPCSSPLSTCFYMANEHRGTTMANNGTLEMQSATGWHKPTKRQMVTSWQRHAKMPFACRLLCRLLWWLYNLLLHILAYTHDNHYYNAQHLQLFDVKKSVRNANHIWIYLASPSPMQFWKVKIDICLAGGDRNAPNISWHLIPELILIKTSLTKTKHHFFQQISSSCLCSKYIPTSKSPGLSNEHHTIQENGVYTIYNE